MCATFMTDAMDFERSDPHCHADDFFPTNRGGGGNAALHDPA
jgi:hypothetical protein